MAGLSEPLYLVKVTNNSEREIEVRYNRKSNFIPPNGGTAIVDFHAARIAFGDPRSRETETSVFVDDIQFRIPARKDELRRLHVRYGTYYDMEALKEYLQDIEVQDVEPPYTEWVLIPFDPDATTPYDSVGIKPMTEIEALRAQVMELRSQITGKSLADLPEDTAISPRGRGRGRPAGSTTPTSTIIPPPSRTNENSLNLVGVDRD